MVTPLCKLRKGPRIRDFATHIEYFFATGRATHLRDNERCEVVGMKSIPHLPSATIEPDISERFSTCMSMHPVGKDSLLSGAELTRSGQHAATVHPYRKPKSGAILERHRFGSKLGRSVDRQRRHNRELFTYPVRCNSYGLGLRRVKLECSSFNTDWKSGKGWHGVHTAAAEDNDSCGAPAAILKCI